MIGYFLRMATVLGAAAAVIGVLAQNPAAWLPRPSSAGAPAAKEAAPRPVSNTLVYRADRTGHVFLDAALNGTPIRFLVDTGATMVALRMEDARAAGIATQSLRYDQRVSTANGVARVAPVHLRELRLGQLVMEDVEAVVVDAPLAVSLLGMSFLKRLDGYEMRDGQLMISW
jgi:aspartyl protease family protein